MMKKFLLFSAFMVQVVFLFGQGSMELIDQDDNAIVNGQNLDVLVEDLNLFETVSPEIFVTNVSSSNIDIKIRVEEIALVEGTSHYFCGLGNCFPPGTMETPNPYTIAAGATIGEEGFFSSHYMPNGIEGTIILRYTYFNVNNLNDTISFSVTFNGSPVVENSLELYDGEGAQVVNGENLEVIVEDLNLFETVSPEIFAKNISSNGIRIKIRAEEIALVEGTSHYFCGLGNCFPPGTMETPNSYALPAGELIGEEGFFSSHYSPFGIAGTTILRYTYFNEDNLNDTISFTVTFIGEAAVEDPVFQIFDTENNEIVNGQEIEVNVEDLDAFETISPELVVKNNSDTDRSIKCTREVIEEVSGTVNYFCALGNCLSPELDETTREYILAAGAYADELDVFSAHYTANGIPGISKFRYTFSDVNNAEDHISFVVIFDGANAVQDREANIEMSAYPNPATSVVQIHWSNHNINQGTLVIYNALGMKVFNQTVNQNTIQIDVSSLERGVYLYRLEGASVNSTTSKLILK